LNPDDLERFHEQHQAQEAAGPAKGETREQEIERTYNEDMAEIHQKFDEELAAIKKDSISAVERNVKSIDVHVRKMDAILARNDRKFDERREERKKSHGLLNAGGEEPAHNRRSLLPYVGSAREQSDDMDDMDDEDN
jgi:hypothetical protein